MTIAVDSPLVSLIRDAQVVGMRPENWSWSGLRVRAPGLFRIAVDY